MNNIFNKCIQKKVLHSILMLYIACVTSLGANGQSFGEEEVVVCNTLTSTTEYETVGFSHVETCRQSQRFDRNVGNCVPDGFPLCTIVSTPIPDNPYTYVESFLSEDGMLCKREVTVHTNGAPNDYSPRFDCQPINPVPGNTEDCNRVPGGSAFIHPDCGICMGGNTGISECPPCGIAIRGIFLDDNGIFPTILPGSTINLSAYYNLSGSKNNIGSIKLVWEVYLNNQWEYWDETDLMSENLTGTINKAFVIRFMAKNVKFRVQVEIACGNNTIFKISNESESTEIRICETDLKFNSVVSNALDAAWQNTMLEHQTTPTKIYEYLVHAVFNGTATIPEIAIRETLKVERDCGVTEVIQGVTPVSSLHPMPKNGAVYTVLVFHTHPTMNNCPLNNTTNPGTVLVFEPGPSPIDMANASSTYIQIVRTYEVPISAGHAIGIPKIDSRYSIYSCTNY